MQSLVLANILSLLIMGSDKNTKTEKDVPKCRVTCTILVSDGFGGMTGFSATAGGPFTSCETARTKACAKASRNALAAIMGG